ncbi:hypothetical protein ACFLWZ_02985 [Chloroflexota bacterium]
MAKGPLVTPQVEFAIATIYKKHPKWKAPMVRNEVDYILHKRDPKLPPKWPSLSTIQKILATLRNKESEDSPLDKPWSVASLVKYPIPAEALPSILQLWVWVHENAAFVEFTIRWALWAARFYAITKDMETLASLSFRFEVIEGLFEQLGKPYEYHEWHDSKWEDLAMFRMVTGQELTPDQQKKILGLSYEEWAKWQERLGQFLEISEKKLDFVKILKSMHPSGRVTKRPREKGGTK